MTSSKPFRIHAPGRVCLFGEHSDYLGLDVIAAAINLGIDIAAKPRDDDVVCVNYADLDTYDEFPIDTELAHRHERDYLRSAFNVALNQEIAPTHGWDVQVTGNIPIAGGLSSSSSLSVASIILATHIGGKEFRPVDIVRMAYEAEVERFGESGGMMDHYASAYGSVIHVSMDSDQKVTKVPADIKGLVIGDSRQKKKDTVGDLKEIRESVEEGFDEIKRKLPDFDRRTTGIQTVYGLQRSKSNNEVMMAETALQNRNITARAFTLLGKKNPDEQMLGELLNEHHSLLRYNLGRSTPKIDMMIDSALKAGALGCKVNGSGGGGTMLAYAPGAEDTVSEAIIATGGIPYKVEIGRGATLTILKE
ncbi:MAG: galactokinase family protein [Candidatus Thorarchaeota archaeon]|nr:galactokinase family protein [Candidatus Thorarchaeota archaeon]